MEVNMLSLRPSNIMAIWVMVIALGIVGTFAMQIWHKSQGSNQ